MTFDIDKTNKKVDVAVASRVNNAEFDIVNYELWFMLYDLIMTRDELHGLGAEVYDHLVDKYEFEKANVYG